MSVRTTLTLTDRLTGTLQKMMKAMNSTIRVMEQMNRTTQNVDTKGLQRARRDIENASASLERLRSSVGADRIAGSLNRTESAANRAKNAVSSLTSKVLALAGAYLSVQGIMQGFKTFTQASDNYIQTNARLANINDGLQTQSELQEKIYRAAQRSMGAYNDMASSVAKLNLLAGDAFSSNDEAIRFTELMNKSFAVSGAGQQEKTAGMHQLTQALASGRLQGDEFRSITENAPLLAKAIADSVGVSMGELKKMSSEGTITADVIKNALFSAADEIETKFAAMPRTFSDNMTIFKNWAQTAFEPLFTSFNDFLNSDAFGVLAGHAMTFVNVFVAGLSLVFDALQFLYNMIAAISNFISQNISWIGPILVVIGTVLAAITAILITKYTVLGLIRMATLAWAAAQWVVNAAYLSNPIVWVLIAIIAVIALVVYALVAWGEQTAAVISFIVGLFAALGVYIYNNIVNWANMFLSFAEFLINLFIDPTYAIKKLFYDMAMMVMNNMAAMGVSIDNVANAIGNAFVSGANMAIGAINWIVDALNEIPGVNLGKVGKLGFTASGVSSSIKNFASSLEAPTSDKGVVSLPRLELANYADTVGSAMNWAYNGTMAVSDSLNGLVDKAKGLAGLGQDNGSAKDNPFLDAAALNDAISGMNNALPSAANNALGDAGKGADKLKGGKLDKVDKIGGKVDLASEYLELFRDIAEGRAINNVITLTPQFNISTNATVAADKRDSVTASESVRTASNNSLSSNKNVTNNVSNNPVVNLNATISEKVDVNDVVNEIAKVLTEQREVAPKGVYK